MRITPALLGFVLLGTPVAGGADVGDAQGMTSRVVLKTSVTADGEKLRYPVTDRPEVTAVEIEIAPGGRTGLHSHPFPVLAWIAAGTLTVEYEGGLVRTFSAGDPLVETVGRRHDGRNLGTVPVRLLVFYVGAEGTPNTRKGP